MHIHIYIHTHTHTHTHTHEYIHTNIYIQVTLPDGNQNTCIYYTYLHVCLHTHTRTHTHRSRCPTGANRRSRTNRRAGSAMPWGSISASPPRLRSASHSDPICVYVCVYRYIHAYMDEVCVCMSVNVYVCVYVYIHVYI